MTFMKRTAVAATLGAGLLIIPPAQAGYIETLLQQGSNVVVATGSGRIDLTGLTFLFSGSESPVLIPGFGSIATGTAANADVYRAVFSGPGNFGGVVFTSPNSGSGDIVSINGGSGFLGVPHGYASGDPLSSTSTYLNKTFSTLGVIPGTYEWMWGPGVNQNFTLQIGPAATVPEPATLVLLGTALVGFGVIRRRRKVRGGGIMSS